MKAKLPEQRQQHLLDHCVLGGGIKIGKQLFASFEF